MVKENRMKDRRFTLKKNPSYNDVRTLCVQQSSGCPSVAVVPLSDGRQEAEDAFC